MFNESTFGRPSIYKISPDINGEENDISDSLSHYQDKNMFEVEK